jgi:hypothetical protein
MEELLNKLIEKGWKPFWKSNRWNVTIDKTIQTKSPFFDFDYHNMSVSTRELISKESGLRQFVCENGMIKITEENSLCNWLFWEKIYYDETHTEKLYKNDNYQYRLIESALKDESELEQFLINSIVIKDA